MENRRKFFVSGNQTEYLPMVSMDGESHPEITLAAVGLGVLVACIILITLIAFITRRKRQLFTNMESGAREMNTSSKLDSPAILTISQRIDTTTPSSYRRSSSTLTMCSDVVTQI
ncbi:uncharacterized protein LOC120432296 [Culex pipiens pallens]|uniref:uncharacterized protein LOC120432296 n=1 Tax=Culex pipiens pallens TaxID=42434 RepID=UPI001954BF9F|nr:uncharacterized protein LOC120432296 [Culex pipiens pallens]